MTPRRRSPSHFVARGCQIVACMVCMEAVAALYGVAAAPAHAQHMPTHVSRPEVLNYVEPLDPNYLRAALEEVGLLGLGFAHYMSNHSANSRDWDYQYTWPSFRSKVIGSGYRFDTNLFETNFVTHPAAGTLYYWAARGNRLPLLASVAYAFAASTVWELLGEFREHASVNDLFVTPLSGFVLGEMTFQHGAFFDRSCASTTNSVLGSVLSPSKSLHDAIDGAKLDRDTICDRNGLTQRGAHEFRFGLAIGMLKRVQGPAEPAWLATQLTFYSRIKALNTFGLPGEGVRTFSDGNVTEWSAELGVAGTELNELDLIASVVPVGLHYRKLLGNESFDASGREILFGLLVATEYSVYRYNRAPGSGMDKYFALDFPGASVTYVQRSSGQRLELDFRASTTLAGVDAFGLPEYAMHASPDTLTTVAARRGYNYAAGFSLQPRVRLIRKYVEVGADLKATQVWAIRMFDRSIEHQSDVAVVEQRRYANVWVRLAPVPSLPWRVSLSGRLLQRAGSVATFRRSRTDLRLMASVEAVL